MADDDRHAVCERHATRAAAPLRNVLAPVGGAALLVVAIVIGEIHAARLPETPRVLGLAVVGCGVSLAVLGGWPRAAAGVVAIGLVAVGLAGGVDLAAERRWPVAFGRAEVAATVVVEPSGHRFSAALVVRTERIDGVRVDRRLLVRAVGDEAGRMRQLRRGDHVVFWAWLRNGVADPWAQRARAAAIAEVDLLRSFREPRAPHLVAGAWLRDRVERGIAFLPAADRALLRGFLLGDTRALADTERDRFRAAGMSHLLAVSGANVAFVLALAGPILRRVGYRARFAIGAFIVVAFAAATRFEPSVLRASSMVLVVMLARLAGRPVAAPRALAIAIVALVGNDPALVHSVGFRLSVAATAGIIVGASAIADRVRGPRALRDALGVTIAAQIAVAPLIIVTFGSIPLIGVVTNLLAAPAAEPLTIYGLLSTLIAPALPAPLAGLVVAPCGVLLAWVRFVAGLGQRVPVELDTRGLVVAALAAGAVMLIRSAGTRLGRPRRTLAAAPPPNRHESAG